MLETASTNCSKCQHNHTGNYCPNCGHPTQLKRINGQYIFDEIKSILNLDKGIFFTVYELLIRPGQSIHNFLLKDRSRLVKPILFIIVCSLIYTLSNHFFQFEDKYVSFQGEKSSTATHLFMWVQEHYGYANILMGIIISFWIYIFFKRYKYNFFEILILTCFIIGMNMLLFALFGALQTLLHVSYMMQISSLMITIYTPWAIASFFDRKRIANYLLAIVSYFLGIVSFSLIIILIGSLVDVIVESL